MSSAGLFVAFFIALLGLTGVIAPGCLITIGQYFATPFGLWLAAILRIGIGLVLTRVAPVSRAPKTLRILGILAIAAGVATLFLGAQRAQAILAWWSNLGPAYIRLWAGLALALGVFLAYAVAPRRL